MSDFLPLFSDNTPDSHIRARSQQRAEPHPTSTLTAPSQYDAVHGKLLRVIVAPAQEHLPFRSATLGTPASSPFAGFSPSATITSPGNYFNEHGASSMTTFSSIDDARHKVSVVLPETPAQFTSDVGATKPSSFNVWLQSVVSYFRTHAAVLGMLVILLTIGISIGSGWAVRLRSFNGVDLVDDTDLPSHTNLNRNVTLLANLINIDTSMQVLSFDWLIDYPACNPPRVSDSLPTPCLTLQDLDCPNVNLFFDQNLLHGGSSNSISSNAIADPIFKINGMNLCTTKSGRDSRHKALYFRTDLSITSMGTGRTLQSYPFDKYVAGISIYAETYTGASSQSIPVVITQTTGLAVGFNLKLETSNVLDNYLTLAKGLAVTRGIVVRSYAICIVLAVWLITLCFMGTCIINVVFGKGVRTEVLVLPVATLFAFTALRSTLPGAPTGFGADIDFIGTLPCLAILTFCSVFMTANFLFRRDPSQDAQWYGPSPTKGEVLDHRKFELDAQKAV